MGAREAGLLFVLAVLGASALLSLSGGEHRQQQQQQQQPPPVRLAPPEPKPDRLPGGKCSRPASGGGGDGWADNKHYLEAAREKCGAVPSEAGRADYQTFVAETCAALRCWCRNRAELRSAAPVCARREEGRPEPPKELSFSSHASPGARRLLGGKKKKAKFKAACATRPVDNTTFPMVSEGDVWPWPRNVSPVCVFCSSALLAVLEMELPALTGLWMQFGVYRGNSLRPITHSYTFRNGTGEVFAFDTFGPGLPQTWSSAFQKGGFALTPKQLHGSVMACMPKVAHPIKGLFHKSLPPFVADNPGKAAFIDIDCDLYQGAIDTLTHLNSQIVPGTVIHFDELVAYGGYLDHEMKALWEWVTKYRRRVVPAAWFGNGLEDGGCDRLKCGGADGSHSNFDLPAGEMPKYEPWDKRRLAYGKFPGGSAFVVLE